MASNGYGDSARGGEYDWNAEAPSSNSYGDNSAQFHDGDNDQAGGDNTCRNCGQEGHFSRDCPEPKQAGKCFNCGEEGHSKIDCPNPKVFTGTCRICDKEGHPAAQCPDKPPESCRNCGEEGHKATECEGKRALEFANVADKSVDEAWEDIIKADKERDLDDLRDAIQVLQKANRELTYAELETEFRKKELHTHVIAYEKDITDTFTLMDLDGKTGRQYHIGYFFSAQAPRGSLKESWPENPEQNMERLQNAGFPVDSMIPKCSNCDELGHISKSCKEEKREREKIQIKCVICSEVGHRARDCTKERIDRFACRNCKQPGHNSKECPEPRSAENVECKNCNKMGHFSKDCPDREPETCRNCGEEGHRARECEKPRVQKCRNCDEEGHMSRECPKPRDWSRVKCTNCSEMGHGRGRCKVPPKEEDGAADGGYGADDSGANGYGNSGYDAGGYGQDASASLPAAVTVGDEGGDQW